MSHYLIFGDSITQGFNDLTGGWVQRLRESLTLDDYVFNLGISGDTSAGLLSRFETELRPRLSTEGDPNFILISIGCNDSAWNNQEKRCWVPIEKYTSNLIQMVKLAKKYTQQIILISPEPIDPTKVDPLPWDATLSYKTELVKQFAEAMKSITQQENLTFVNLFNLLPQGYIKTLDDGVHPNATGHKLIFNLVRNVLK